MKVSKTLTRREWLRKGFLYSIIGAFFATLGGIILDVLLAGGRFSSSHWTQLGSVSEFQKVSLFPIPQKKAAIIRHGSSLAALSMECTHLGCLLNATDHGFFCPCHGSVFSVFGEVYSRPATKSLKWHKIAMKNGRVWVHTGRKQEYPHWINIKKSSPAGH